MTIHPSIIISLFAGCFICILGCTSLESTFPVRSQNGTFSANCLPCSNRGVPCKVRVPTAIRAVIEETVFVDATHGNLLSPSPNLRNVRTEDVFTDQVFLVHIPRPLAGTLDLTGEGKGYHFDEDGYLTSIGAYVEDKTISDIAGVLGDEQLGGLIKTAVGDEVVEVLEVKRVIAAKEFSLAEPNWHLAMNDWIEWYTKDCTKTCDPHVGTDAPTIEMQPQPYFSDK